MIHTRRSYGGICVAPHHLAAEAGRDILKAGGHAVDAMVAAAASIAVTYPHMNALGGDGFWLIHEPGKAPVGIDACGGAAGLATPEFYATQAVIPERGPLAALTMAGTVNGWEQARALSAGWGEQAPLDDLLADAIRHARHGISISESQYQLSRKHHQRLRESPGFAETFLRDGDVMAPGQRLRQPRLANTLEHLARHGLDDFYRGALATSMAYDLTRLGSPLRRDDFTAYRASQVTPLQASLEQATLYNLPAPTQGIASLMILALFERLQVAKDDTFGHLHGLVEATKRAFMLRDQVITDPNRVPVALESLLTAARLDQEAARIDRQSALPWPSPPAAGDTVWLGCIDQQGRAVSFIQSLFWEFGSGVVLPESGVLWQNRGISFSLDPDALRGLAPQRKPFHTLNPALARFKDGRTLVYGTMGGEGQPQTQAAVFSRYAFQAMPLQAAISAPRWLLGRTWGEQSTSLKLESRFEPGLVERLSDAGHEVERLDEAYSDAMGHAGAIVHHPDGLIEGAHDPRSDGGAAAV